MWNMGFDNWFWQKNTGILRKTWLKDNDDSMISGGNEGGLHIKVPPERNLLQAVT